MEVENVDYVKIAEGYGVPGSRVTDENQLQEAVDRLLRFDGPFLIDLVLTRPA